MNLTDRNARIEAAGDACRENAAQTVVDNLGQAATRALDFNEYQFAVDTETLAQAAYFADEYGVTAAEVLSYLNLA